MRNKLIAAGIVIGAVALGLFLITKTASLNKTSFFIQGIHSSTPPSESLASLSETPAPDASQITLPLGKNLTQEVAQKITTSLLARNPDGPTPTSDGGTITAADPKKLVDDLLTAGMQNFDAKKFSPDTIPGKIHRTPLDGAGEKRAYAIALNDILQKYLSTPTDPSSPSLSDFTALEAAAGNAVDELYALPVPQSLLSLHLREIRLIGSYREIFKTVTNADADPLTAIFALRLLPQVSDEFTGVGRELKQALALQM
jgi:hypothetical protein